MKSLIKRICFAFLVGLVVLPSGCGQALEKENNRLHEENRSLKSKIEKLNKSIEGLRAENNTKTKELLKHKAAKDKKRAAENILLCLD